MTQVKDLPDQVYFKSGIVFIRVNEDHHDNDNRVVKMSFNSATVGFIVMAVFDKKQPLSHNKQQKRCTLNCIVLYLR